MKSPNLFAKFTAARFRKRRLKYLKALVEQCEFEELEYQRNEIDPKNITLLIKFYWKLSNWEQQACLIHLLQDYDQYDMQPIMLDFLKAPFGDDDLIEMSQAIALGFIDEKYDNIPLYENDRELLDQTVEKCLKEHGMKRLVRNIQEEEYLPQEIFQNAPSKNRRLLLAAEQGNQEEVTKALAKGANIDALYKEGDLYDCSALLIAVINKNYAIAEYLIDHGADVHFERKGGQSVISWSCMRGNKNLLLKLLDNGVDVNRTDQYGVTPLMEGVESGDAEIISILITAGADIFACYRDGRMAIDFAVEKGHTEVVKTLINAGNTAENNNRAESYVMRAACYGLYDIAEFLINKGANVNFRSTNEYTWGWTPLMYACRNGHSKVVKLLLERGADVSIKIDNDISEDHGYTALEFATGKRAKTIQELLKKAIEKKKYGYNLS